MAYIPVVDSMAQRSRDLFVFSYLTNGVNLSDICRLRWANINGDTLPFIRQKTAESQKGKQTKIVAKLFPESWVIINRWSLSNRQIPENYVFPFLNEKMDEERQILTIHQVGKITNKWMRRIGKKLGIESDITTYVARHSFATILLRSNAPLAFISQSLGHTNIQTTQNYLGAFEDEQVEQYLNALI